MLSYDFIINTFKKRGANKYIVIKKFSPEDSKLISDALIDSKSSVYFSDSGSIDVVTETTEKTFGNSLTGYKETNSTNIELKIKTIPSTQKYVFSRLLGLYVLYIASPREVTLRYNPVPRPEIINLYKQSTANATVAKGLIMNACIDSNGLDPVCSCINRDEDDTGMDTEFCMNDLFGTPTVRRAIKKADRKAYDTISGVCFCTNSKCQPNHPVVEYIIKKEKGECPKNLVVTLCNSTINAGRDLKAQDINLQQNCGSSQTTQTAPEPSPSPAPSPAPSQPVTGSTYTSDVPPSSTTTTTKPKTTTPTKVTQIQAPPKQKDNTMYIIIAIALLIVIIVAYFMLKSPSQRFYKRHF